MSPLRHMQSKRSYQAGMLLPCFMTLCLASCASLESQQAKRPVPARAQATAPAAPVESEHSSQQGAARANGAALPGDSTAGSPRGDRRADANETDRAERAALREHDDIRPAGGEEAVALEEPLLQPGELRDPVFPDPKFPDPKFPEPRFPEPLPPSDRSSEEPLPEAPSQPAGDMTLNVAPLETSDMPYAINLATALRLADARPLVVTAAQASAWIAEAQLQRANLIWVPTLNMGADYIRHDGFGPDFNRGLNTQERPLNQNVNFLYTGLGLIAEFALTDAIFQPLAARQTLNARRWDIQTAKNDALLATARAYFDVHEARGKYAGAVDVVQRTEKLVDRIARLSEDLVPKVEVARAKRMLASAQQNAALKREKWRVSSADLTQVLRLDPRVVVDPTEPDHLQITLIDPARPLDDLIPTGLTNRPELCSHRALVDAVAERIRRERGRMLLPSLMLSGFQTPNELIQVGAQGFGADSKLDLWSVRSDFSPQVVWQLDAMGLGNLARIKEQRGEQSRAIVELFKVQDGVAAEVTRAQAALQSAAARAIEAERSLHEAIVTFDGNYEGLAQTKRFGDVLMQAFRPQEAVIAVDELIASYDQYFATVADYNRAQFELYHATGYPALELTELHTPGETMPVDTSRPGYLPTVEEGPPPATR